MATARCELSAAWTARQRRCALRDGASKVQITERVSCHTVTRTVTSWHQHGKAMERAAGHSQHHVGARPSSSTRRARGLPAQHAAQEPAVAVEAESSAPRAARNSRQRRAAERSAQHHKRLRLRRLWRRCIGAVLVIVRLLRLLPPNALREGRLSPSKRTRDEEKEGASGLLLLAGPSTAGEAAGCGTALQAGTAAGPARKRAGGFRVGFLLGALFPLAMLAL